MNRCVQNWALFTVKSCERCFFIRTTITMIAVSFLILFCTIFFKCMGGKLITSFAFSLPYFAEILLFKKLYSAKSQRSSFQFLRSHVATAWILFFEKYNKTVTIFKWGSTIHCSFKCCSCKGILHFIDNIALP